MSDESPSKRSKKDESGAIVRLAIVGGRQFDDVDLFRESVDKLIGEIGRPSQLISGGAVGADSMARDYGKQHLISVLEHFPDYDNAPHGVSRSQWGKIAPLERNKKIVADCTHMIAFPTEKSIGTYHSIELARKAGIQVTVIKPTMTESATPSTDPHFYVAAKIGRLHATLTFVENATPKERVSIWNEYCELLRSNLPFTCSLGERIKVGPNKDLDAVKFDIQEPLKTALLDAYKLTHRRSNGAFPELTLHVTVATEEKLAAAAELGTDEFQVTAIYAATTGSKKAVLAEFSQSSTLAEK